MARPKQSGLGRGLGELFRGAEGVEARASVSGTAAEGSSRPAASSGRGQGRTRDVDAERSAPLPDGSWFQMIPIGQIHANPKQPRQVFDEDALAELADSIGEVGVLQPVVVRQTGDAAFELVMGERRWRACQAAGLNEVPAIVRATEDGALLRDALLENLHRAQLNPLEEAAAYQQLLEEFGCTQDELAKRIKRSRPQISNTIRLLKLPALVQRRVAAGVLSSGHARALLVLEDPLAMERLAQRIVAEGLSVRATEEIVALGERPAKERVARGPRSAHPRATALADDLSDRFDTRVKVDIGRNRGRITIEFGDEDDLNRVLTLLQR